MSKDIQRLNALLRQELGEPLYAWKYSEYLIHHARAIDPHTSKLIYNYRCRCGLNATVHLPDCGLVTAEPVYIECKLRPDKKDQWCLCKLHPSPSEDQWLQMFGTYLPWPKRGTWQPCDPVWLDPGEHPNEVTTWETIYAVRRNRVKSLSQLIAEGKQEIEDREKRKRTQLIEEITEDTHLPFGSIAGRKDHVSWPSVIPAAN